ncbi:amidase, partial [Pseudomonas aeruginosa]
LGEIAQRGFAKLQHAILHRQVAGVVAELGCEVEACLPDYPLERLWRTWLVHRQWLVQGSLGELYADPARRVRL